MNGNDTSAVLHGVPAAPALAPDAYAADPAEQEAHEMQAISEGVVLSDTVTCLGERYRIRGKVGLMPMMKFAVVSKRVDDSDLESMVVIYELLRSCILPADWDRFVQDMTDKDADAQDMLGIVNATWEILNARPTQPPSASSDGPPTTSPASTDGSWQQERAAGPRAVPDWVNDTVAITDLRVPA